MRYLFFDIECSNCHDGVGKMCEFGYVVTNENFCELERDNIIINPESEFDKLGFAIRKIKLSLPYKEYYRRKNFKAFYDRIKNLFKGEVVAIGHNTQADAQYILDACNRYGLPSFNYRFIDTQKLVRKLYDRENHLRLIEIHNEFFTGEVKEQSHEGLEDALFTKDIAQYLCTERKVDLLTLMKECSVACGEVFNGRVIENEFNLFRYSPSGKMSNKTNKRLFEEYASEVGEGTRTFSFPSEYERDHFPQMMVILSSLKKLGYGYSAKVGKSEYVTLGDGEYKLRYARKNRTLTFDDFLQEIGLSKDSLDDPDVFSVVASMQKNKEWYSSYQRCHKNN